MKGKGNYTYRIVIEPDEGNTYHAYVPALKGCHTWGDTLEEARMNIYDAMKAYIQSLIDDGEELPKEKSLQYFQNLSTKTLITN